ncbi:hypothetical protein [Sphingomonas arenae]|nr:hypothetical protein [Sphingomonas arenae]
MRSAKPLMWMAAGSMLTLLVVWGPHRLFHAGYDAGTSAVASISHYLP